MPFNIQVGFIGLVEEEWLVTLATVDREEVTYLDFVTEGIKLAKELREEVRTVLRVVETLAFCLLPRLFPVLLNSHAHGHFTGTLCKH